MAAIVIAHPGIATNPPYSTTDPIIVSTIPIMIKVQHVSVLTNLFYHLTVIFGVTINLVKRGLSRREE
jgi:hypothetical protein